MWRAAMTTELLVPGSVSAPIHKAVTRERPYLFTGVARFHKVKVDFGAVAALARATPPTFSEVDAIFTDVRVVCRVALFAVHR